MRTFDLNTTANKLSLWQQLVTKDLSNRTEKILSFFLPLFFMVLPFVNTSFFFLNGMKAENEEIKALQLQISMVLYIIVLIFITLAMLVGKIKRKENVFLIFSAVIFTLAISIYGYFAYPEPNYSHIAEMIIFANGGYIVGYALYHYKLYNFFTLRIETFSLLVMPMLAYYGYLMVTDTNPYHGGRDLGVMNYLTVSNDALPIILAITINFIRFDNSKKIFGFINLKFNNIGRLIIIFLLWYAVIIPGGTRGAILTCAFFTILAIVVAIYIRSKIKKSILVGAFIILTLVMQFVYPINEDSNSRMLMLFEGLTENKIVTSSGETLEKEEIDKLVEEDISGDGGTAEEIEEAFDAGAIGERGNLISLAITESLQNPIGGLGPMGFHQKYIFYPHNAVLELLADFGIIIGSILVLGVLYVVIRAFAIGRSDNEFMYIILFVLGYFVKINVSGSIYTGDELFFALGITLPYMEYVRQKRSLKKIK